MAFTAKKPSITPSRTRAHRSTQALAFAASFVVFAGFAAVACGGNSSSGTTPGGHAASANGANGGEGDGTGGSAASSNSGGSSGSVHTTGGSSSASGGSSSSSGGSDAAGADASGGTTGGTTGDTGGTTSGGSTATGGSGATGGTTTTGTTACDNGLDDDGDGLIDGFDPECTGPWDNDEGSFATGIPGDNSDPKWQDCFFDGNSGAGDDGCRYPTQCLTGDYDASDPKCELANACKDYCAKLTPNGCDCFGCCSVQASDGSSVDIFTTSSCSIDKIDDEAACPRCQKSLDCQNTCGECELCPGKTEADLPESCQPPPPTGSGGTGGTGSGGTDSGTGGTDPGTGGTGGSTGGTGTGGTGGTDTPPPPNHTCDGGLVVCDSNNPCGSGFYCQQGCCMVIVR